MKKSFVLMLFILVVVVSACQGEEEPGNYSGVISDGKAMGYQYIIVIEESTFTWEIGYKGNTTLIEEKGANEQELESFMMAVNDGQSRFWQLVISVFYLLIVLFLVLFLYKKNKPMLKGTGIVITVCAGIALYTGSAAFFELNSALEAAGNHYQELIK